MTSVQIFYVSVFVVSMILTLIYSYQWHSHFNFHMTSVFLIIPIIDLAFLLMYSCENAETAMLALKFIYVGSCILPWLVTMCITGLCGIKINRFLRMGMILLNIAMYSSVLTIGKYPIFYKSFSLEKVGGIWVQHKEYGFMHTVFYIFIACYLLASLSAIIYTYIKNKQASRKILALLFIPILFSAVGYFINHYTMRYGIELVPLTYTLSQLVYIFIAQRMVLYNVSEMVIESMVQSSNTGFVTVDFNNRYLGSNETARTIIPGLSALTVDQSITNKKTMNETVSGWINSFRENENTGKILYVHHDDNTDADRYYTVTVSYMYDGRRRCGYQIFLEDDTQNQKYIKLLDGYNSDLQKEVAKKTESLIDMHNRLILGMATMVESRDNSTGGHIRRTSEGVRILLDEMTKDNVLNLSDEFCKCLIKAAPMHDLGKIAVDDAILRKNGPFTPEEREKMKEHAKEGARIVHEILKDTDDEYFHILAENVAHYHHERYDGKGYPDGLKGEEIPLEARIMAVADVYDALVSKRVYKEKFSFEKADAIVLEGMGTQFDPQLKKYYEQARPRLEEYYSKEQ